MATTSSPIFIPWEVQNIPSQIQLEFSRREGMRGLNYVDPVQGDWGNSSGTNKWQNYKGPQTPWIRITSNGYGSEANKNNINPGFILASPSSFFNSYGFNKSNDVNKSIIGYQPDASFTPHTITNNKNQAAYSIHVPPPQIENISIIVQHELYRKATINWICFSKQQLEYMTPYFLIPSLTFVLEWGWNNFNTSNLIDLSISNLTSLFRDPYQLYSKVIGSNGTYDAMLGTVSNFSFSSEGNKFKCMTEVSSRDRMYSGILLTSVVEDIPVDNDGKSSTETPDSSILPFGSLIDFIDNRIDLLRSVLDKNSNLYKGTPVTSDELLLTSFINYVKSKRKDNWREYIFGIFYGRDLNPIDDDIDSSIRNPKDFDIQSPQKNIWVNLGLVIDVFNFCNRYLGTKTGDEFFRIDIDDIKISAHRNMISADGSILLIPNCDAPKYLYGLAATDYNSISKDDISKMSVSSHFKKKSNTGGDPSDTRLQNICAQPGGSFRDDLDELINNGRYSNGVDPYNSTCEFPTGVDFTTGYLKNLYVNTSFLKRLIHDTGIKTYTDLINKMMESINGACGNFWDFRLVSSTGNPFPDGQQSTMKIVDIKYIPDNVGLPYTFKHLSDNSILTSLEFKPTISDAQAIRSLYAATNIRKNATSKLNNGSTELLDYMFRDRLFLNNAIKNSNDVKNVKIKIDRISLIKNLQTLDPTPEMFQMTSNSHGKVIIRRLALPSTEVLNMLLDDGDYDNNPTYVGIMPGIQATFTLQGIGGLRTFMLFLVDGLPEPYSSNNIVFRIVNLTESIEAGKWTTAITAGVIPLRNGVRKKLGLPPIINT